MKPSIISSYTSKIIKAGALLADTKTLLLAWDTAKDRATNLAYLRDHNLLGKASRSRLDDILPIFQQRYLGAESLTKSLVILAQSKFPTNSLDKILYFHAAQSDALLRDIAKELFADWYATGRTTVNTEEVAGIIKQWVREGKTVTAWSDSTIKRVAQGLLSTLRDFGMLQGAVNKKLSFAPLPLAVFAYVAFWLYQIQPSGEKLLQNPNWRLFLLMPESVEKLLLEAHQAQLLEYYAAGSVIRISFPATKLEDYARVIIERTS